MTIDQPKRRAIFNAKANFKATKSRKTFAMPDGTSAEQDITTLSGYAMIWNALSSDRGGYQVKLLPGSAKFTTPCHALYNHDFSNILGSTENGTLRIMPDDVGVKVEIDLPDTCCGEDVGRLVDGKYVNGMSFSMLYDGLVSTTVKTPEGDVDEVSSFMCDEVTITAIPSFTDTSIGVADTAPEEPAATAEPAMPAEPMSRIEDAIRLERLAVAIRGSSL